MTAEDQKDEADFYGEGVRNLQAGKFALAASLLSFATIVRLNEADALAALCLAAHEGGRHDMLYASFLKLTELPEQAAVLRGLAISNYDAGLYAEAVIASHRSLALAPDVTLTYYILGRSYLALHRFAEAQKEFQQALKLADNFAVVEALQLWVNVYLSAPTEKRIPLLLKAPVTRMHRPPPDARSLAQYPFTPDSLEFIEDIYSLKMS